MHQASPLTHLPRLTRLPPKVGGFSARGWEAGQTGRRRGPRVCPTGPAPPLCAGAHPAPKPGPACGCLKGAAGRELLCSAFRRETAT